MKENISGIFIQVAEPADIHRAVEWFSVRIKRHTGNPELEFPADWMPETALKAVDENGHLLALAMLYLEKSSPVAVCGWCIAKPDNRATVSFQAVSQLMADMPEYARSKGAKYLMTTFGDRGINAILDKQGFINGESATNKFLIL